MTNHALAQAVNMAVTGEEIRDAFDNSRDVHRSSSTGALYMTRGRITLVVREGGDKPVVVTIMWARPSDWAADAEYESYGTRNTTDFSQSRAAQKARRRGGKQRVGSTK